MSGTTSRRRRSASSSGSEMAFTIEAVSSLRSMNTRRSPNWRLASTRATPLVLGGEGDGGVDRNRGVPDTTLGPVKHDHPPKRRLADPARGPPSPLRASRARMRAMSSAGWNGLTMSSSAPARRPFTRWTTSASLVSRRIGTAGRPPRPLLIWVMAL